MNWINILAIVLEGCVLEVDLKYLKELHRWNDDCSWALDKIENKRQILSDYQIKGTDF